MSVQQDWKLPNSLVYLSIKLFLVTMVRITLLCIVLRAILITFEKPNVCSTNWGMRDVVVLPFLFAVLPNSHIIL